MAPLCLSNLSSSFSHYFFKYQIVIAAYFLCEKLHTLVNMSRSWISQRSFIFIKDSQAHIGTYAGTYFQLDYFFPHWSNEIV